MKTIVISNHRHSETINANREREYPRWHWIKLIRRLERRGTWRGMVVTKAWIAAD